ncbi:MAG: tRNA epoxyqueuosine(34) reductase QueG [Alphaproteobacteria bacterium]|jgi:epoxyqueuosine reductase|nr:tRNA epoxyqueuosine(34) reductase QueG [Alphaproteobacteria bacterium]HJP21887.1 tRNA epoxyqueuosine(34) reductase QueG [Alphaproteobacteria bacterium]
MAEKNAKASIRAKALELGFDAVGFAPTAGSGSAQAGNELRQFLEQGCHGDMAWLGRRIDQRAAPTALWPAARSAIVLGSNYGPGDDPLAILAQPGRAAVSVYAHGRDYHGVVKKRLKSLGRWLASDFDCQLKVFVDTAPLMEKPLAQSAALGWQGKHTNLVSRRLGSWLFLGVVLTTLELEPDQQESDHCGSCRRCLDICPTGAFIAPYRLDARRCISYLTIEHQGHIPAELRPGMGNRVFGCDDCLAVCPWNKFAQASHEAAYSARPEITDLSLAELAALDDAAFRTRFRQSPLKRTGRDRLVRNALIGLGNAGDASAMPLIESLLDEPSPVVRAMAVWAALQLLDGAAFDSLRENRSAGESDSAVRAEWG